MFNFLSTFSFVLLTFLLILILFHGASDINLLVELNMAGKNQRIELVEEFIGALREEVSLWDVTSPLYRNRDEKQSSIVNMATKFQMSGMYHYMFML